MTTPIGVHAAAHSAIPDRHFTELPPLALYIHLPWCVKKCPYCDFNSHEAKTTLPEAQYVDALLDDLAHEMPSVWGRTFSSVFIGGGTPSLFSAKALHDLLSGVRALTGLTPNAEVTMEANPGAMEAARFHEFRSAGVNRLSIGIQSFSDTQLKRLGRVHNAADAHKAIEIARTAGFDNLNLDLMFGLPEQSCDAALNDVSIALGHEPEHLSYYELTIEPNTVFAKYPPEVPDDDVRWDMQQAANERLSDAGFSRYEVSAWSQPGRQSQHNCNYWLFGDYVGIGAGAHGKISFANTNTVIRRWKHKHPNIWMDASGAEKIGGEHSIAVEDTGLEFMMNALRLTDGFQISDFTTHTGLSIQPWLGAIEKGVASGLLARNAGHLRATERGFELLNDALALFMDEPQTKKTGASTGSRITIPIKPA